MKRIGMIAVAATVGIAASVSFGLHKTHAGDARAAAPSARVSAGASGALEAPRHLAIANPPARAMNCPPMTGGHEGAEAQLVAVRVGTHPGYDRVTFQFARSQVPAARFDIPRFTIQSVKAVHEDPRGNAIPLGGNTFAQIVFWGASGYDLEGKPTYPDSRDLRPGFPVVAEAMQAGDFERVLTWGFGLSKASCWHGSLLADPMRVVIDFPHTGSPEDERTPGQRQALPTPRSRHS